MKNELNLYDDDEKNPHYYTVMISNARLYKHPIKDKLILEVDEYEVGEVLMLAVAAGMVELRDEGEIVVVGPEGEA